MDDVVDAMLDDNVRSPCYIHLDGEACSSFQTVCLIGDAVILPQDARAADSTTNNGGIGAKGKLSHIVRPCLCGDGVTIAHYGMIVRRCQHIDGVQEIEPVGMTGQVEGQFIGLGIVAIGIVAL